MSKQYLEAHTFLKTLRDKGVPYTETLVNLMQYAVIEEVAPVVHAYNKSKDGFLCSACTFGDFGLFNHGGKYTPKYCPNCGARMDGGRNDR